MRIFATRIHATGLKLYAFTESGQSLFNFAKCHAVSSRPQQNVIVRHGGRVILRFRRSQWLCHSKTGPHLRCLRSPRSPRSLRHLRNLRIQRADRLQ